VYELKQKLQQAHAADAPLANFTRWVYKGRVLDDDSSLAFCEVKSGDCIIGIKTKVATKQDPASASAAAAASAAAPSAAILPANHVATRLFDGAMHELLAHNGDNLPGVQACIATLVKICEHIISQPMTEKFRRVPSNNSAFRAKVGQLHGGPSAMRGLGFMLNGATADWMLVPSAEAWENLVACYDKLSRFHKRLLQGGAVGAVGAGTSAAEGGVATSSTGSSSMSSSGAGSASTTEKVSSDEAAPPAAGASTDQTAQQVLLLAMALAAKANKDKSTDGNGIEGAAKDSSGTGS